MSLNFGHGPRGIGPSLMNLCFAGEIFFPDPLVNSLGSDGELLCHPNLFSSPAICESNMFDFQGNRIETVTLSSRLLSSLILLDHGQSRYIFSG